VAEDQARPGLRGHHRGPRRAPPGPSRKQRELDTVTAQLDAKQAVVDQYLADYEDNTIDRDTVTR
jgi:hypothetical protein